MPIYSDDGGRVKPLPEKNGFLRPIIKEVTAGHHEARRAVVISWCLGRVMRLPRRFAPRNDVWTADEREGTQARPFQRLGGDDPVRR
jgi:hypothetical protein